MSEIIYITIALGLASLLGFAALQEEGLARFKGREVVIPDHDRPETESERDRW